MEKTDSGCILLKIKEYDELIAKKPDIINITWKHEYYMRGIGCGILRTDGKFVLSDKIGVQLTNILRCLRSEFDSKLNDICYAQKMEDNKQFSKLSWWKRLTFNKYNDQKTKSY